MLDVADIASLDPLAAELYARPPGTFTAARNACADADAAHAAIIRGWRKPTVAAWAVNVIAALPELAEALALADEVRRANASLDGKELARLGAKRRAMVSSLVSQAITVAAASGVALNRSAQDEVAATINAALSDPPAAAAVLSGRLTRALEPAGFGPVDLTDALAGSIPARKPDHHDDLEDRRARREAARAVLDAEQVAEGAQRDLSRIDGRVAVARERAVRLRDRADALRSELTRAETESARAAEDAARLDRERTAAVALVRESARAVVAARTAAEE